MRLVVYLQHMFHRQLRVALRSRETFVAEQLLNGTQVGALFQHVRAKSVAQGVGMHLGRESASHRNFFYDPSYAAGGQPAAALIDEQRV